MVVVELIFCDLNPEELCDKFEFRCCDEPLHNPKCHQSWDLLKKYLKYDFFKQMDSENVI